MPPTLFLADLDVADAQPIGRTHVKWGDRHKKWGQRSSVGTLRLATHEGYISHPADDPPMAVWRQGLTQPALIRRSMVAPGKTQGRAEASTGALEFANADGRFDFLDTGSYEGGGAYRAAGRPVTIRMVELDAALSSATTVLVSRMKQQVATFASVSVQVRDRVEALQKALLQTTRYLGNNSLPNGLEGVAGDLKGKPKPLGWGKVRNIPVPQVNSARLEFEQGVSTSVDRVMDSGVDLAQNASDYASQSAMEASAPAAGTWRAWSAGGYVRLGAPPGGEVTLDVTYGASSADRTIAQVVLSILTGRAGFISADYVAEDFTDLDALQTAVIGFWSGTEEMTIADALDRICASGGVCWYFDALDRFRLKRLDEPSGDPVLTLTRLGGEDVLGGPTTFDILTDGLQRLPSNDYGDGLPAWKVVVNYQLNNTVQTQVAGSVLEARKAELAQQWRTVEETDEGVLSLYPDAPTLTFDTLFDSAADAAAEAVRLLNLYGVRRDRLRVKTRLSPEMIALVDLNDVVQVRLDRFDYADGRLFRVIGMEYDLQAYVVTFDLWG